MVGCIKAAVPSDISKTGGLTAILPYLKADEGNYSHTCNGYYVSIILHQQITAGTAWVTLEFAFWVLKYYFPSTKAAPVKAWKMQHYICLLKMATSNSDVSVKRWTTPNGQLKFALGDRTKDRRVTSVKASLTWKWQHVTKCSSASGLLLTGDATHARQQRVIFHFLYGK